MIRGYLPQIENQAWMRTLLIREILIRRTKFRFAYAKRIIDLANARIFAAVSDYLNEPRTQLLKRRWNTAFSRSPASWKWYWTAFEAKMLREWPKSINQRRRMWSLKQGNFKSSILLLRHNQWSTRNGSGARYEAKCFKFDESLDVRRNAPNSDRLMNRLMKRNASILKRRNASKFEIAWWSKMLQLPWIENSFTTRC